VSELCQSEQPFAAIALEFLLFQAPQKAQGILLDRLSVAVAAELAGRAVGVKQKLWRRIALLHPRYLVHQFFRRP
jgi:hypothetical protein